MIDELNTTIQIIPPPEAISQVKEPFEFNDVLFYPKWNDNKMITYYANIENLKLNLIHDKLCIKNSWHKYLLGNNYTDYKFTNMEETFLKLEGHIKQNLGIAQVKKIAYGCVIRENPILNYPNWLHLKNTIPQPMLSKGRQYGCFFPFSDYKFKGYDKSFEVWRHDGARIPEDYFRIEKEVKYLRHLQDRKNPIQLRYVRDIFNKDLLYQLANDLFENYNNITKRPIMENIETSLKDLQILAIMQNEPIRERLRQEHGKTYKNYNKRFKQLTSGENGLYYCKVGDKIKDKLELLINS